MECVERLFFFITAHGKDLKTYFWITHAMQIQLNDLNSTAKNREVHGTFRENIMIVYTAEEIF